MHRSNYLPLTSALALATAVALIGMAGALSTAPAVSVPSSSRLANEATNIALVREFYAAVNEALRTGDVTPPDRLVSADRGVPPLLGDGRDRATVARRLVSIRTIYTGARVVVDDLLAQGDVVMARVRLERAARGAFLEIPVPVELAGWGPLEVFRIAAGRIVERWASREPPALLEPLLDTPLTIVAPTPAELSLVQLEVAPGASLPLDAKPSPRLLYLRRGRLAVEIDGPASLIRAPWRDATTEPAVVTKRSVRLEEGDLLVIPADTVAAVSNAGETQALMLNLAVVPVQPPSPLGDSPQQIGLERVTMRHLGSVRLPAPVSTLAVGRATLAPGVAVPVAAEAGLRVLTAQTGTLGAACATLGAAAAASAGRDDDRGLSPLALVTDSRGCSLHNAGDQPLAVVVLRVSPQATAPLT